MLRPILRAPGPAAAAVRVLDIGGGSIASGFFLLGQIPGKNSA
jgi:hypothetical protein